MADFYSDHYTATVPGIAIDAPPVKIYQGVNGGAIKVARASCVVPASASAADVLRMFTLPSGARIIEARFTTDGLGGSSAVAIGWHNSVRQNRGSATSLSSDNLQMYAAAGLAYDSAQRADRFSSNELEDEDRGKPLWQHVDEAGLSLSEDPLTFWDLGVFLDTVTGLTGGTVIAELWYT